MIEMSNSEQIIIELRKKEKINSIKFAHGKNISDCKNGNGANNNDNNENENENGSNIITAPLGHIPFEFERNSYSDSKNNDNSSVYGSCITDLKESDLMEEMERRDSEMRCPLTAKSYFLDMMETMSDSSSIGVCVYMCALPCV